MAIYCSRCSFQESWRIGCRKYPARGGRLVAPDHTLGRLMGSEARGKMRKHWDTRPNRVGENEAFWWTLFAVATAACLGLLVYSIVGR